MIARAVRIDRAYQYRGQMAHIFAPDDPMFRRIVDRIEAMTAFVAVADLRGFAPAARRL